MQSEHPQNQEFVVVVVTLQSREEVLSIIQEALQAFFRVPVPITTHYCLGSQEVADQGQKVHLLIMDYWMTENHGRWSKSREEKVTEIVLGLVNRFNPDYLLILDGLTQKRTSMVSSRRSLINKPMREALNSPLLKETTAIRVDPLRLVPYIELALAGFCLHQNTQQREFVIVLGGEIGYFISHAVDLACRKALHSPILIRVVEHPDLEKVPMGENVDLLIFDHYKLKETQAASIRRAIGLLNPDYIWVVDESGASLKSWIPQVLKESLQAGQIARRIDFASIELSLGGLLLRAFSREGAFRSQGSLEPVVVVGENKDMKSWVLRLFTEVLTPTGFSDPVEYVANVPREKTGGMLFVDYQSLIGTASVIQDIVDQLRPRIVWVIDPTARSLNDGELKEALLRSSFSGFAFIVGLPSLEDGLELPLFAVLSSQR